MSISVRSVIVIVALAAASWLGLALGSAIWPTGEDLRLALLFLPLMAAVTMFPLHFDYKTNVVLDTVVVFAAALLFEPTVAMLTVGSGALIGMLLRRRDAQEITFNTAQVALQAGVGSQILAWSGWELHVETMQYSSYAVPLLVAGSIYLINTILTSLIIGLQTGHRPMPIWIRAATRHDTIEQISQFVLGWIAACQIQAVPLNLPLLVFPILVIYISLTRWMQLRHDTVEAVEALADLVDLRDPYTCDHARRVAMFAREIATDLGLDYDEVALIERAGRVHDLGKLVLDRALLAKPGRLSDREWWELEQHPVVGAKMLARFPEFAAGTALVRAHHERVDGNGYPDRLRGEEIPLGARILAVADAFDAMSSARPYRPALSRDVVLAELERGRGTQWDTVVVESLIRLIEQGRIVFIQGREHACIVDGSGQIVAFEQPLARELATASVA